MVDGLEKRAAPWFPSNHQQLHQNIPRAPSQPREYLKAAPKPGFPHSELCLNVVFNVNVSEPGHGEGREMLFHGSVWGCPAGPSLPGEQLRGGAGLRRARPVREAPPRFGTCKEPAPGSARDQKAWENERREGDDVLRAARFEEALPKWRTLRCPGWSWALPGGSQSIPSPGCPRMGLSPPPLQ